MLGAFNIMDTAILPDSYYHPHLKGEKTEDKGFAHSCIAGLNGSGLQGSKALGIS